MNNKIIWGSLLVPRSVMRRKTPPIRLHGPTNLCMAAPASLIYSLIFRSLIWRLILIEIICLDLSFRSGIRPHVDDKTSLLQLQDSSARCEGQKCCCHALRGLQFLQACNVVWLLAMLCWISHSNAVVAMKHLLHLSTVRCDLGNVRIVLHLLLDI